MSYRYTVQPGVERPTGGVAANEALLAATSTAVVPDIVAPLVGSVGNGDSPAPLLADVGTPMQAHADAAMQALTRLAAQLGVALPAVSAEREGESNRASDSALTLANAALRRSLDLFTDAPLAGGTGSIVRHEVSVRHRASALSAAIDASRVAAANIDPRTLGQSDEPTPWEPANDLSQVIADAQQKAVGPYGEVARKVMLLLARLTSAMDEVRRKLTFKEGDDKSTVTFPPGLDDLFKDIASPAGDFFVPLKLTGAEKATWQAELGDLAKVDNDGIRISTDLVEKIRKSLPAGGTKSMVEYQAWYTGFTNYRDLLQMNAQRAAEGFSRAVGNFDNLVRVLSNALASLTEMMKTQLAR
ncbi:IpaD/SipD/SspD family type III secretion system needle tip protein [Chitinasiproducens palmae]|uniref:Translocator protein BipD n=1 Tax=Chitinasiproducens palmae TaxID=1770053 RepID=A0A1H2PK63_9BURK|nr:IpaD/SipD/SspD family type III secretion system needle tip protein [Chitinasiproducens palmae]SDV46292.1 Invasion plasmid antigen IpaD [Chitinasiproducens palmae]